MSEKSRFMGVRLSDSEYDKLTVLARCTRRSRSAVLRLLLERAEAGPQDVRLRADSLQNRGQLVR